MKRMQSSRSLLRQVVSWMALVNLLAAIGGTEAMAVDANAPVRIVAFGDSLTAGYLLPPDKSFPVQLETALRAKNHNVAIANAGVSGDTTGAALERLDWSIPPGTEAVIVELGANDALRGLDPGLARTTLDRILERLRARNIEILVAGMLAPKNWGPDYEREFNALFADLAQKHGALLYPFFLDGVALNADLTLEDGLHPTDKGIAVVVDRIMPRVEELIARVKAKRVAASEPAVQH